MAYFVKENDGNKVYRDFLTESQQQEADNLLKYLQDNFPAHTEKLKKQYGEGTSLYFYHMGRWVKSVVEEHDIPDRAQPYLFSEIKYFAPDKERIRDVQERRNPYYQAFLLSALPESTVANMSFNKWQSLLERPGEYEDKRIFDWIGQSDQKSITVKDWRNFLKLLHSYLKKIDTEIFTDKELFTLYDTFISCVKSWTAACKEYKKRFPKGQKLKDAKTANKWQSKYYSAILEKVLEEDDDMCQETMNKLAIDILITAS